MKRKMSFYSFRLLWMLFLLLCTREILSRITILFFLHFSGEGLEILSQISKTERIYKAFHWELCRVQFLAGRLVMFCCFFFVIQNLYLYIKCSLCSTTSHCPCYYPSHWLSISVPVLLSISRVTVPEHQPLISWNGWYMFCKKKKLHVFFHIGPYGDLRIEITLGSS